MMKCVALVALAFLALASAAPTGAQSAVVSLNKPELDLCPTCIQFAEQSLNLLIQIVANEGIIGGCSLVCGELANKTGHRDVGLVCDLLCSIVGIEEFVKILDKADLDPIYYCELLNQCPIVDNGDAHIVTFQVTPPSGPRGTTFTIEMDFVSKNGTGTGSIDILIHTVDGLPIGDSELLQAQKPGKYGVKFNLDAKPDPQCDPSQGPCEEWLPGAYNVQIAVCNGECGSKHPHSQVYDQAAATFTITN